MNSPLGWASSFFLLPFGKKACHVIIGKRFFSSPRSLASVQRNMEFANTAVVVAAVAESNMSWVHSIPELLFTDEK